MLHLVRHGAEILGRTLSLLRAGLALGAGLADSFHGRTKLIHANRLLACAGRDLRRRL